MPVTHGVAGSSPVRTAGKKEVWNQNPDLFFVVGTRDPMPPLGAVKMAQAILTGDKTMPRRLPRKRGFESRPHRRKKEVGNQNPDLFFVVGTRDPEPPLGAVKIAQAILTGDKTMPRRLPRKRGFESRPHRRKKEVWNQNPDLFFVVGTRDPEPPLGAVKMAQAILTGDKTMPPI